MPQRRRPATKPQRKPGRPSSYRAEFAEQAGKLCRLGATDADLADFFGVTTTTINNWKGAHPEFLASLKTAKAEVDALVVRRLFERAIGYEHEAVKITVHAESGQTTITPYVERYPPDTTAAIFWLKNRQPEQWRDRQQHEHSADASFAALVAQAYRGGEP